MKYTRHSRYSSQEREMREMGYEAPQIQNQSIDLQAKKRIDQGYEPARLQSIRIENHNRSQQSNYEIPKALESRSPVRDIIHNRKSAIQVYASKSPTYQSDFAKSTFLTTAHTSKSKLHTSSIRNDYSPGPFTNSNSNQISEYKHQNQSVKLPKEHGEKMAYLSSIRKSHVRGSEPQKELGVSKLSMPEASRRYGQQEADEGAKSTSRFDPKPSAEKSSPLRKNYDFNNSEIQGKLRNVKI